MAKNLVIVESPAKAKTINKYLGSDYKVLASFGHVRDLIPKSGAVDPNNDFAMKYQLIEKNANHVSEILKEFKKADHLYLATDPDREGEAISFHLAEIIKDHKGLKSKPMQRVVFHEITKSAIQKAIANPREISMDMVNAQQARRALDYLVGFNLSPLLWKKIRRGLSAGRVQSPALRMIVEREEDIEKFVAQEYWSIATDLNVQDVNFNAKLIVYKNEKLKQFSINSKELAENCVADLTKQGNKKLTVAKIEKKTRSRNPTAPFITSTLQQEAIRKLGFTAQRAMRIAQQLYEGIDIGDTTVGLITYMRTDSVNLSDEALTDIREAIVNRYGKNNLPDEPRVFKTKSKNAQEAHEAIRPTSAKRTPDQLKSSLSPEQLKLYELIWKRTVASQMISATIDTVSVDLACGSHENLFRASGSTIVIPGFLEAYQESFDDHDKKEEDEKLLPALKEGDVIPFEKINPKQHFTEPPPRYGEASLVKSLEEHDIGRPSTYASIISTLQNRGYVTLEGKKFIATDVGRVVNKFLTQYFNNYVDYDFTAKLEDELDAIARGEEEWIPVLTKFWQPFVGLIKSIDETVQRSDVTQEKIDEKCPKCDKELSIRLGRGGRFVGCTGFPECDYTRPVNESAAEAEAAQYNLGDRKCPDCEHPLKIRHGRYGKFIGCSNYPTCKYIEPLEKPKDTEVTCPKCNEGTILERKSKRGKIFYSCSKYPDCTYALWNEPIKEKCPTCDWPILTIKTTKARGTEKVCPQENCKFSEPVEDA